MTGDDALLYTLLAHGADGGILASAHLATERFVAIYHAERLLILAEETPVPRSDPERPP